MQGLQARFLRFVYSTEGRQADLMLIEPNGDEHLLRCLCRPSGATDIGEVGDGSIVGYLNHRYGAPTVCSLCRQVTLSGA
ncbi:MAG: hypothetical protein IT203_11885 [Fimbriimonadaceae bacterium]|nr:hypothetical protein [Fimbriimonadaceae bacterium]